MANRSVPQITLTDKDVVRFLVKVSAADEHGCRRWLASLDSHGYGQFRLVPRTVKAHLASWAITCGAFPSGLEPDHLCNNRDCVEPGHLEWVTHEENCRRIALRSEICGAGLHRWDEQDAILRSGARECRPCRNARKTKRYHATGKR